MQSQLLYKTPRQLALENSHYQRGLHYPLKKTEKYFKKPIIDLRENIDKHKEMFSFKNPIPSNALGMYGIPFPTFSNASINRAAAVTTVAGWKELGRASASANEINVTGLTAKRYYMILGGNIVNSVADNPSLRFNADAGANYADRLSAAGTADATQVSQTSSPIGQQGTSNQFNVGYISNFATKEKELLNHSVFRNADNGTDAPSRMEAANKWANVVDQITSMKVIGRTGNITSGELVVLEWSPEDTHTIEFWTELDSVTAVGNSTTFATNTFTAKKYLWIQTFITGPTGDVNTTFNGDTGANYARRYSVNGAADATNASQANISNMLNTGTGRASFCNMFIINVSTTSKLVISHNIDIGGAGAGVAPGRLELSAKWGNTTSQITSMSNSSVTGNFGSASIIKVWGAD